MNKKMTKCQRWAIDMLKIEKLPEDVLKGATDRIQDLTDKYNKIIDEVLDNKTKDLMSV